MSFKWIWEKNAQIKNISNGKRSTDSEWPCILCQQFVQSDPDVYCLVCWQTLASRVIVIQATDEWRSLYDLLWSFHCSSTDTILLSIYTTPQLNPDMGVWRYWGINFCRSRVGCLTRTRSGSGGKTLLSVTQAIRACAIRAIRACETQPAPSTPPNLRHHTVTCSTS